MSACIIKYIKKVEGRLYNISYMLYNVILDICLKPWLQALTEVVMVAIVSHHHQNKEVIPMSVISGYPKLFLIESSN